MVPLTGYSRAELQRHIERGSDFETFFADAPSINPKMSLITGVVCGVPVEEIEDPLMRKTRYLDTLIDELAKGNPLDRVLRHQPSLDLSLPLLRSSYGLAGQPGPQRLCPLATYRLPPATARPARALSAVQYRTDNLPTGPLLCWSEVGVHWRAVEDASHQGPGSRSATLRSQVGRGWH